MTTLTEYLKEHARRERAEAPARESKRAEWLGSVERLLQQVEAWLHEADTEGILQVGRTSVDLREAGIGAYSAPALTVKLGVRRIEVLPEGRNTFGQVTRADTGQTCLVQGSARLTDGSTKYIVYRIPDAGGQEWFLVDRSEHRASPFDRAAFERVMLSLLQ